MVASNVGNVAWAPQTAKGTLASASVHRLYLAGGEQPHSQQESADFVESTGLRMVDEGHVSTVRVEGAPQLFVRPDSIFSLLYGVLGAKAVTGAADPYTHTATPALTLPYFTFWRSLVGSLFEKFGDVKVSQVVIHGESGKALTVTATLLGLTSSFLVPEETTAAIEKPNKMMHYDGSGALLVEGVAASSIRSFDITINNNVSFVEGTDVTPYDVAEGGLEAMVRTTQLVTDFALWNRVHYGSASPSSGTAHVASIVELAGTPAGIQFKWTRVAASPGPERSLQIAIPRLEVLPFDLQPTVGTTGEPLTREVTYKARQPASGASITATVKNSKVSY